MSTVPLPPGTVIVAGPDVALVAHCVRREIERARASGGAVPAPLHRILEALTAPELPSEATPVPTLVEADEVPSGWVSVTDAVRSGLVPVSEEALRGACRRGRVPAAKVKGCWFVDPTRVKEHPWRAAA